MSKRKRPAIYARMKAERKKPMRLIIRYKIVYPGAYNSEGYGISDWIELDPPVMRKDFEFPHFVAQRDGAGYWRYPQMALVETL